MGLRRAQLSSKALAGTIPCLDLTFPAVYSPNLQTRFKQVIQILEQLCEQCKSKIPALGWRPISITARELTIILREPVRNSLTQRGDISVIHAKKQTFGKRYTLQINPDRSSINLAVAGSSELYDLFIDINQDGNLLLSHKALLRPAGKKKLMESQLVTTPSDCDDGNCNYMYYLSYKQPFKRRATGSRSLKLIQLQQLSLSPEIYVVNNGRHAQKTTAVEFEKMFGVKLLHRLSVAGDKTKGIAADLENISSSYRRLQQYIDGQLAYDAGIKDASFQDVSQEALLDAILVQVRNKKRRLPRVVIARVNDLVGYGLMAGQYIPAGAIIGEYCGEITKVMALNKAKQDNTYFAAYAPDQVPGSEMFVVDARKAGNSTRFINHSSKNSNAAWMHVFDGKRFRSVIAAVKPVEEGDQILLKYKDSYWSSKRERSSSNLPVSLYPL